MTERKTNHFKNFVEKYQKQRPVNGLFPVKTQESISQKDIDVITKMYANFKIPPRPTQTSSLTMEESLVLTFTLTQADISYHYNLSLMDQIMQKMILLLRLNMMKERGYQVQPNIGKGTKYEEIVDEYNRINEI